MKSYYLQWMLFIYIAVGVVLGTGFSLTLDQFIPIPGEQFVFFMIASAFAGALLGTVNYLIYYFFTKMFIRHFNRVLNSVKNGDLSARTQFHTGGIVGELNTNINKTLANLERSHNTILHDDLTRIPNRHALQQFFMSEEESGEFAMLFIDVDDFKTINDTYGHVTGDEVLRYIAFVLHESVKGTGQVYRLSGDEFVILQKVEHSESTDELCGRIYHAFEEPFHIEVHTISIRISIGLCQFEFGASDFATILDEADQEMYKVKNSRQVRLRS
ncbi:GGDEF domain-containing protein [Halobacillus sp. Nhm2S1]|uniref:GGDEF domain-containing protein n=1 Tax=Halobacillus sp. Nhm2S1 TaxID=2866716 RepID=UPI001C730068|nr:GGDEF domain-containing protein [Halobacillus sp. Nhm2S1]MBX0356089.1 GGDEF domain-containing protein [Halobacillus sp. Nhm2S1]